MATTKFINECKKPANSNRLGQVTIGSTTINQHDYLSSMTLNESCYVDGSVIGTNYSKSVDVNALDTYTGTLSSGETINPKIGVLYDDNKTEYIDFGNYISEVSNENQTSNATSFTGYDKMINGDAKYICSIETFPSTVGAFYLDALSQLNLQPESNTFVGSDITVTANPFTNNESIRDVLSAVEKVSCTFGYINKQGKHELRWFSSTVDYEFSKSDYSTLEGGNIVYGPVNRLLIGNPNIEGDYVLREDESSIEEHGANELYIYEPYFLFNDTLRNEVIDEIWNKVNGFTYTKYELTSYYGKPFLEIGNKIKINRNDDTSFESYVLSHNLEYAGSFTSTISADVMTKEEKEHKNNSDNTSPLKRAEIKINKQEGQIELITSSIEDLSSSISVEQEGIGSVFLKDVSSGVPELIRVHPIEDDISYIYPSNNLFPKNTLFMKSRKIIFINNTNPEDKIKYIIPKDLLWYDEETYDEFVFDYSSYVCYVTKRVYIDEEGNKQVYEVPNTINIEFPDIKLNNGNYTIKVESFNSAYIYAKCFVQSAFTNNFVTNTKLTSALIEESDKISSEVKKEYATKDELGYVRESVSTQFEQTNEQFNMKFKTVSDATDSLTETVGANQQTIEKNIQFVDGNIILGNNQSSMKLQLENNKIAFKNGTDEKMALTDNSFELKENTMFKIGDFAFIPRANGSVSWKKV